ncbi:MAG: polysaccharide pyruvyl transferase family protein [Planctomycetota bacterium]
MRVGILTFGHVPNYGAVLQAYGLQESVRALGHDASVVHYRCAETEKRYQRLFRGGMRWPFRLMMMRHFSSFRSRHLREYPRRAVWQADDLRPVLDHFDALIVGSDQVWAGGAPGAWRGFDESFYLLSANADRQRLIAYAPSAGGRESFGPEAEKVTEALGRFHHLSVRDAHTADLVESLGLPRPPLVLDPTLIHGLSGLGQADPHGAIVVFGTADQNMRRVIAEVRRHIDAPLWSLRYRLPGADRVIRAPRVEQWAATIAGAAYVITSYFHGTLFALKSGRPFSVPIRPDKKAKVSDFLGGLGLTDRMVLPDGEWHQSNLEPGKSAGVSAQLETASQVSQDFLRQALA